MSDRDKFVPEISIAPSVLEQKDVDSINRLNRQLHSEEPEKIKKGRLTDILCQPNIKMVLLRDPVSKEIIGMASLYYYRTLFSPEGGVGRIEDVVIDERYRGQGLGRIIVDRLILLARWLKLETLELTSNPKRVEANRMYPKLGFQKYDTNVYTMDL